MGCGNNKEQGKGRLKQQPGPLPREEYVRAMYTCSWNPFHKVKQPGSFSTETVISSLFK